MMSLEQAIERFTGSCMFITNQKETCEQFAKWFRELQRARVLLKATHDLLEAADDSPYVEDALGIIVHYDGADCEGRCLMEDIEYHFDEFGEERRADDSITSIRTP